MTPNWVLAILPVAIGAAAMKRIRILHSTSYFYRSLVRLGPHQALLRPREGHDVQIVAAELGVEPHGQIRWLRDIYGNSIAVLTFSEPTQQFSVRSDVTVALQS